MQKNEEKHNCTCQWICNEFRFHCAATITLNCLMHALYQSNQSDWFSQIFIMPVLFFCIDYGSCRKLCFAFLISSKFLMTNVDIWCVLLWLLCLCTLNTWHCIYSMSSWVHGLLRPKKLLIFKRYSITAVLSQRVKKAIFSKLCMSISFTGATTTNNTHTNNSWCGQIIRLIMIKWGIYLFNFPERHFDFH